ncbi:hypothetical protein EWM64_g9892 [Hericium alpestre]|uniref:Dienelactone hydrolase domain-containing protein n=1 Tax=Hericium alpestre TaxID=135208 RepID=A0A4Y9ZIX2_9AGAM|nr:hypothetical protein EWM64_g9892 [Hericium alpestre]
MVNEAYYSPAPGKADDTPSPNAIILLTDIFGLPLNNCKILADLLASKVGVDVWVPDLFDGPPPFSTEELTPLMPDRAGVGISTWDMLRFIWMCIPRIPRLYANRATVVDARVEAFVKELKAEKKYGKLGAVGYCFGGSVAIRIGGRRLVDSIVVCHPGSCTLEQIQQITVPASWACAEDDLGFGPKLRSGAEEIFKARQGKDNYVDYEFVDYKGTAHGFAARPNLTITEVQEGYNGALQQTADWFKKTL